MIHFLRKIRKNLITNNKISTYFKYAIGEIVLVMIGILLALQINNWNEDRTQKNEFNNILKTIERDLKTDTLVASVVIKFYEEVETNSLKIINKEVNKDNYKEYPKTRSIVSVYRPFNIQTKGYEMAKKFSSKNQIQNDSIFTTISQFYNAFSPLIKDSNQFVKEEVFKKLIAINQFVKEEVFKNIEAYKKYDWYVNWTQGKFNKEMIQYFTESKEYRKQVASHNLLAVKNHLNFVKAYKKSAEDALKIITKHLKNKE